MTKWFTLVACLLFSVASIYGQDEPKKIPAPPAAQDDGLKTIFNGKDLTGWSGDPRLWSVRDGAIHGETTKENAAKGNTFLIWQDGKTADFELQLNFRCNATNNSGIQYRSKHITEGVNNDWVVRGYQHEIRNEVDFPNVSAFIYEEGGKRGRVCQIAEQAVWNANGKKEVTGTLVTQEEFKELFKLDDWNHVRIVAKGKHIQHFLNDKLVMDFTDNDPDLALTEGVLALQLHAGAPMWVEFKNVRIKTLSDETKSESTKK